jgi:hypothetical protein
MICFTSIANAGSPATLEEPAPQVVLTQVPDSSAQNEFFEKKVRPLLAAKCLECHSHATELNGGLSLDSKTDWSQGGDSGPAINLKDWEQSLVWSAIGYLRPKLQMPPDSKLTDAEREVFRQWLSSGAYDPRESKKDRPREKPKALSVAQAQQHWAYRPLRSSSATDASSPSIDSFLAQQQSQTGVIANPVVGLDILKQRLALDLHGLRQNLSIPSSQEQSYEAWVDAAIASPHFGERMARRWMDVVRFAESVTLRGYLLPDAWRYRNYLIDSFNADKAYHLFVQEQIAGDLMDSRDPVSKSEQLTATTMLALGDTNLEEQDKKQLEMDFIDEQLDTIGKVFLAQTIGCARCHDHKFDPIPTADYYALAGIMKSSVALEHANISKWTRIPLPLPESEELRYQALELRQQELKAQLAKSKGKSKSKSPSRQVQISELQGIVVDDAQAKKIGSWSASTSVPSYVGDGYLHDGNAEKGIKSISYEPKELPPGRYRVRLSYTHGTSRSKATAVRVSSADGDEVIHIDQSIEPPEEGLWISLGTFRFEANGQAFVIISNEDTRGHVVADAVQFIPESISNVAANQSKEDSPSSDSKAVIASLEKEIKDLQSELDQRPMVMSVRPMDKPTDLPIHVRGSVHQLGAVVPRGFLTAIVTSSSPKIDSNTNGRLELAQWIAHADNPLTARVYVNRVWYWLMGEGLVRTLDNFGTTGEAPSNEALLNWLTQRFIDQGWSTKWLVREIVLSQAYRRCSRATPELLQKDPDNRTFARSFVRRLDAESLRDSLMLASGELKLDQRPNSLIPAELKEDFGAELPLGYRAVYGPWFRNSLPDLYAEFDGASPCVSVSKRTRSTIAQQSLALLNSPFVLQRAKRIAERLLRESQEHIASSDSEKSPAAIREQLVRSSFERLLLRQPTPNELAWALEHLEQVSAPEPELQGWTEVVHDLIASVDFRFIE